MENISKIKLPNNTIYNIIDNQPAIGSASGELCSFSDGSNLPMPKLQVGIEPVQDLHGYDSPWVGGAGKNKLPLTIDAIKSLNTDGTWNNNAYSINGGMLMLMTDNSGNVIGININGMFNDSTIFLLINSNSVVFPNNQYILNGISGGSASTYRYLYLSPSSGYLYSDGGDTLLNLDEGVSKIRLLISSGYNAQNVKVYPMVRLASVSDATFAPYSNICPIIGWSAVDVTRCGKNLCDWKVSETSNALRISLKPNNYVISAESTLPEGNWYIRFTDSNGEYSYSASDVGLNGWSKAQSGWFYGWFRAQEVSFIVPSGCTLVEIGKLSQNGTINAQLEIGTTATTYTPYNGQTYTIDLDGTRYGGKLDVVSGVLTVEWIAVSLGNINYTKSQSGLFQTNEIANTVKKSSYSYAPTGYIKSSHFREIDSASITGPQGSKPSPDGVMAVSGSGVIYINYLAVTDVTDFKTAMNGVQLVYELATPQTIQLTPTAVKSLLGSNNVWADTGEIIDCEYKRDATAIINSLIARIEALENQ